MMTLMLCCPSQLLKSLCLQLGSKLIVFFQEAKDITYLQFVSKFAYIVKSRCWRPHKGGNTIGRLNWVPPSTGELYYLRMMLVVVKGPTTYEKICTVNGQLYSSFREACLGFLQDDKEYIEALREVYHWGSG